MKTVKSLKIALAAALVSLPSFAVAADMPESVNIATAKIQGCGENPVTGTLVLTELPSEEGIKQVFVALSTRGLADGKHAVHIHETGKCEPCSAAGGHFDPGPHGHSAPDAPEYNHPFHSGDLENVEVVNGQGVLNTITNRFTLSDGRLSIFDEDGAAVIIHSKPDTYCDHEGELTPGCAGGSRDACGIIQRGTAQ